MILSIPVSRESRRWVIYLDDSIREHIAHQKDCYLIDIRALRVCGIDPSRIIEEATKRFGAERIDEN